LPGTGLPINGLPGAGLPGTGLPINGLPWAGLPVMGLPIRGWTGPVGFFPVGAFDLSLDGADGWLSHDGITGPLLISGFFVLIFSSGGSSRRFARLERVSSWDKMGCNGPESTISERGTLSSISSVGGVMEGKSPWGKSGILASLRMGTMGSSASSGEIPLAAWYSSSTGLGGGVGFPWGCMGVFAPFTWGGAFGAVDDLGGCALFADGGWGATRGVITRAGAPCAGTMKRMPHFLHLALRPTWLWGMLP